MKMQKSYAATMMTAILILGGCAIKEAPPLRLYTFETTESVPVTHSRYRHRVLKISYPQTLLEPISDKMAFSYGGGERGYYQNAQWTNNIGKMLEGDIIHTLQHSRQFKAVIPYASTVQEDLRLESIIYDISHHIRGEESYAIVSVRLSLIDAHTGKLLKAKRFSYKETTPTVDAQGYVAATNRVLDRFNQEMILWLKRR